MTSIIDALKNFDFTDASMAQNVNISLGNGDNEISVVGDNSKIETGNGNNTVEVMGDDDSVLVGDGSNNITTIGEDTTIVAGNINKASSKGNNTIMQVGDNAKVVAANGNNKIYSYSNNATIASGNGNNTIGSLGNNVNISVSNGNNNNIAFWGNNDVIKVGNGNNNIKTLDWLNGGPQAANDEAKKYVDKIALPSSQSLGGMTNDANLMKMASYVQSSFTINSISTKTETGTSQSKSTSSYRSGKYVYTKTTTTTYTNYTETITKNMTVNGVDNTTVKLGNGSNDVAITGNKISVSTKDKTSLGNNKIHTVSDVEDKDGSIFGKEVKTSSSPTSTTTTTSKRRYSDPLIVDFNGDGQISAIANKGVDLDGDASGDVAATNGDKMLAMSDLNGNGEVDGAEIFGNNTVDPFTGKTLNAENGFDALAKLAESAEKHTGVSCIDTDGNVNLADLQKALATKGIKLGFVSDANNSMIEDLEKVISINVSNYTNNEQTDENIFHAQTGSAIFDDGTKRLVEDIWVEK